MARLKSRSLRSASKKSNAKNRKAQQKQKSVEDVVQSARKPTNYALKTALTFAPVTTKSIQSFAAQQRSINNWLKNSSPFRSTPGGTISAQERRITMNARSILGAMKTDIKKGHLLDFRNTNAALERALSGVSEEGFDSNYDAELDLNSNSDMGSSSYADSTDNIDIGALAASLLDGDTFMGVQEATTSATLEEIDNAAMMTTNAVMESAEYSSNRIVAGTNVAMSHMMQYQSQTNEILGNINENMVSLVNQMNSTTEFQEQTMSFYQNTEDTLNKMLELMKYTASYKEEDYSSEKEDKYDFLAGGHIDFKKLGNNIMEKSMLGMYTQMMVSSAAPVLSLFGIKVPDKLTGGFGGGDLKFNPIYEAIKKSPFMSVVNNINNQSVAALETIVDRINSKQFTTGIENLDAILGSVADLGVLQRENKFSFGGISRGETDKGIAHLTGATIDTIERYIPEYLANIEHDINTIAVGLRDGSIASSFQYLNPDATAYGAQLNYQRNIGKRTTQSGGSSASSGGLLGGLVGNRHQPQQRQLTPSQREKADRAQAEYNEWSRGLRDQQNAASAQNYAQLQALTNRSNVRHINFDERKFSTTAEIVQDFKEQAGMVTTQSFNNFFQGVMRLIGNKGTPAREENLKAFIRRYGGTKKNPALFNDALDELFQIVFDPSGLNGLRTDDHIIREVVDLQSTGLDVKGAYDYLMNQYIEFVNANKAYAKDIKELTSEVKKGYSPVLSQVIN